MGKINGKSVINFISPTCLKILSFNGFNGKIKTPFERTLFGKSYLHFSMTFHEKKTWQNYVLNDVYIFILYIFIQ